MEYIKEERIKNIDLIKENVYVLIDFDRTITSYDSLDSWGVAGMAADEGCEEQVNKLYEKYRPIEMDYNISYEEKYKIMEEWYNACMNLYYKYHLNKYKLQEAVKNSGLRFRKGAKEFLEYTYENNIPVIILSAGIGNSIEQFLKDSNCLFNETMYIVSNFIEFDDNGKVTKFDNSKMIHTLNKTLNGHLPEEFIEKVKNKQYKILVGDLIEDIKMVNEKEEDTTLRIGILTKEMENEKNLELYKERFDVVLTEKEDLAKAIEDVLNL